jgi:hypothetical protein
METRKDMVDDGLIQQQQLPYEGLLPYTVLDL